MEHNRRKHPKLKKQPPLTLKLPFKTDSNRFEMRNYVPDKRSGYILQQFGTKPTNNTLNLDNNQERTNRPSKVENGTCFKGKCST